jgi:hypothetical protein
MNTVLDKFPSNIDNEAADRLKSIKKESRERWITILKERSQDYQPNDRQIPDQLRQ